MPVSPLAQGRGLKQDNTVEENEEIKVAPRAGAWIETFLLTLKRNLSLVAPRAGAWIETFNGFLYVCY